MGNDMTLCLNMCSALPRREERHRFWGGMKGGVTKGGPSVGCGGMGDVSGADDRHLLLGVITRYAKVDWR